MVLCMGGRDTGWHVTCYAGLSGLLLSAACAGLFFALSSWRINFHVACWLMRSDLPLTRSSIDSCCRKVVTGNIWPRPNQCVPSCASALMQRHQPLAGQAIPLLARGREALARVRRPQVRRPQWGVRAARTASCPKVPGPGRRSGWRRRWCRVGRGRCSARMTYRA